MPSPPSRSGPSWPPLPVTIVPGQSIFDLAQEVPGVVVGLTEAYCLYWAGETDRLAVTRWRDIALANICPAPQLLPLEVTTRDHHNASATVLRELLGLRQVSSLTAHQQAAFDELVALLCPA